MNGSAAFIDKMQYLSLRVNETPDAPATIAEGVAEKNPNASESNAIELLITNVANESMWPVSVSEYYCPAGATASPVIDLFENPTPTGSTESPDQNEGNANETIAKQKLYVAFFHLTHSIRDCTFTLSRGNNTTGRTGKLLCRQCRYWRVKVRNIFLFRC